VSTEKLFSIKWDMGMIVNVKNGGMIEEEADISNFKVLLAWKK
jgi:hypothetical protein